MSFYSFLCFITSSQSLLYYKLLLFLELLFISISWFSHLFLRLFLSILIFIYILISIVLFYHPKGTENVALIAGLGAASQLAYDEADALLVHMLHLKLKLILLLKDKLSNIKVGDKNISNFKKIWIYFILFYSLFLYYHIPLFITISKKWQTD